MKYIKWNGKNLEEVKDFLGDKHFIISEHREEGILDLRFKKTKDKVMGEICGYFAEKDSYIFVKDDKHMILDESRFEFLREFLVNGKEEAENNNMDFANGELEVMHSKVDEILVRIQKGTYCSPIYERDFE